MSPRDHSRSGLTARVPVGAPLWGALALAALAAAPLAAQSARIRSTTTARYAQLRPIRYDSAGGGYVALPSSFAAPLTQDIEVIAWGLGVSGLRGYALLRGRAALGSELVWPRSDDHFDALYAYLELERPRYRVRAGRQQRSSGLGWYAYDGLTATWRPRATVRLEGYGGRGAARGFLEAINSPALASLDPLRPDHGTLLFGVSLWAAPSPVSSFTAIYQRELLSDRSGLVSERAALDAKVGIGPRLAVSASADADLADGSWGKARVGALVRFARQSFLEIEAFRYRPVLDLTTIWGVFAPEAHRGLAAMLRLAPTRSFALSSSYTYRRYEPISAQTPFLSDVDDDAQQLAVGARWTSRDWVLDGSYRLQLGFGGAQSGGDVSVAYAPPDGWRLGVRGVAFQRDEMFRAAGSTVFGVGADARGRLSERLGVRSGLVRYFHRRQSGQAGVDWSQTRGEVAVEWVFGSESDRRAVSR